MAPSRAIRADLLLGGGGEVDDDRAVVGPRVLAHPTLQHVEHDFEAQIPIHMDVELVTGVPSRAGHADPGSPGSSSTRRDGRRCSRPSSA